MVNQQELLDRFGDIDFLLLLWRKSEREIPSRIEELERSITTEEPRDWRQLTENLHKMRGLIANFLTSGQSVQAIQACEREVEEKNSEALLENWQNFRSAFEDEISEFNAWLEENS